MKFVIALFLFLPLMATLLDAPVYAGTLEDLVIALHLQPWAASKNQCANAPTQFGCDGYQRTSLLNLHGNLFTAYNMYVVILDINPSVGIQAVSLGINFDPNPGEGVDTFGSEPCADTVVPEMNWPSAEGGATFTWDTCQNTIDPSDPQGEAATVVSAIYTYAYSPDTACIYLAPLSLLTAVDCSGITSDLTIYYPHHFACAGFGGAFEYQPCLTIYSPVEETSWGALKRQFHGETERR